jgi:hypothetical protein
MNTSKLPPPRNQDYHVDVQVHIYKAGSRYGMHLLLWGKSLRASIDMTEHDLRNLNEYLKDAVESAATERNQTDHLNSLSEIGNRAFNQIFSNHEAREAINSIAHDTRTIIQITTEDFFLPWELLYPENLNNPRSYNNFWGANFIISRIVEQDLGPGAFVPPEIFSSSLPRLGLLTCQELEYVKKQEIPFFEHLEAERIIKLSKLRILNPNDWREELKTFKLFLGSSLHIAHFACHACCDQKDPYLSHIILSDNFHISIQDLDGIEAVLKDNPLVILNACETGSLNPLYTSFFAKYLLKYGARGVVATECALPDKFAADFTEQFYGYLLRGVQLGEALLMTRRQFLDSNNPAGLLYSLYASPSIRII